MTPSTSGTAAGPTTTSPRRRNRRPRRAAPRRPGRTRWRPPGGPPRWERATAPTARSRRRRDRRARRWWSAPRAAPRRAGRPRPSGGRRTAAGWTAPRYGRGPAAAPTRPRPPLRGQPYGRAAEVHAERLTGVRRVPRGAQSVGLPRPAGQRPVLEGGRGDADVPPVGCADVPVEQRDRPQPRRPGLLPVVPELVQQGEVEPRLRQPGFQVCGARQQSARVLVATVADQRERAVGGLPPGGGGPVPSLAEDPHDSRLPVPFCGLAVPSRAPGHLSFASNHVRLEGRSLPMGYPAAGEVRLPRASTRASASTTSGA